MFYKIIIYENFISATLLCIIAFVHKVFSKNRKIVVSSIFSASETCSYMHLYSKRIHAEIMIFYPHTRKNINTALFFKSDVMAMSMSTHVQRLLHSFFLLNNNNKNKWRDTKTVFAIFTFLIMQFDIVSINTSIISNILICCKVNKS